MNNYQSDFFVFKSVIAGIAILYFVMISFSGTDKTEPLEEKMIYSDVRRCFPHAVVSIIISNTLGMKKLPRMKEFLITTNAF